MVIMSSSLPGAPSDQSYFADKFTIETPEQTALDFAVAGVGSRFVALALDTLIQGGVGLVLAIAGGFGIFELAKVFPKMGMWGVAILVLVLFVLYFGYFAFFEIMWNGQTPGKRAAGIRVIKESGRPLTPAESIGRNLMRIVDSMPTLYAVGIISALVTKRNQRLGDLLAGALVVRESSLSAVRPTWQLGEMAAGPVAGAGGGGAAAGAGIGSGLVAGLGGAQLSAEDYTLIDSFLNRRMDLEPHLRFRMADEILRKLRPKLTLPAENTVSSEKILEALAYQRRAAGGYS